MGLAQDKESFEEFRNSIRQGFQQERQGMYDRMQNFRDSINMEYAKFLRDAWSDADRQPPRPIVAPPKPVEPTPYVPIDDDKPKPEPVVVKPVIEKPVTVPPRPEPVAPVKPVTPVPTVDTFEFPFYGLICRVRMPREAKIELRGADAAAVANGWEKLAKASTDGALYDLLEIRDKNNLSDWAYLQLINELANKYALNENGAALLAGFLFANSGYKIRFGADSAGSLHLMFGSYHAINNRIYFVIDGMDFYSYKDPSGSLRVSTGSFPGEKPLSLIISREQNLGYSLSDPRPVKSKRYADMEANSTVPLKLIEFYNTYPRSHFGGNFVTCWATYAMNPLPGKTRDAIYPTLRKAIAGMSEKDAANRLINWVQTGFVYGYDDEVWGGDRPFFAEETLYYPFSDCEDRSILYSRLVRDLLGLKVALIYYPGHLATAVRFNESIEGDCITIDGEKFLICDPTYVGAPIGEQMPKMRGVEIKAIVIDGLEAPTRR